MSCREGFMSPQTETKASVEFKDGVKDYKLTYYTSDYETKNIDILAAFRVTPQPGVPPEKLGAAVAAESSIGTWTTVWTDGLTSLDRYKGRCYGIEPVPGEDIQYIAYGDSLQILSWLIIAEIMVYFFTSTAQLRLAAQRFYCSPTTPFSLFRMLPFRSPLLQKSLLLSFPLATKMFQFSRLYLACPWIQQQFERPVNIAYSGVYQWWYTIGLRTNEDLANPVLFRQKRRRVVSWSCVGTCGFRGTRRGTPFAAQTAAANTIRAVVDQGMQRAEVMIKGPGLERDATLRAIIFKGWLANEKKKKDFDPLQF
ncbi:hypothetical protein R6Q57_009276 [Mikania cordata]